MCRGDSQAIRQCFFSSFHRHQAARVLARERFGASPEERDKKIFPIVRVESRTARMTSGKFPDGNDFGETLLPLRVERNSRC